MRSNEGVTAKSSGKRSRDIVRIALITNPGSGTAHRSNLITPASTPSPDQRWHIRGRNEITRVTGSSEVVCSVVVQA